MKKRFYLFALLTTMLLSSAYASNWVQVPLTDTYTFDETCQYRFIMQGLTGYAYPTYIDPYYITVIAPNMQDTWTIKYSNKTIANGAGQRVAELYKRCD